MHGHSLRVVVLAALWWLITTGIGATLPAPVSITIDGGVPYFSPKLATAVTQAPVQWRNTTGSVHTITHEDCERADACLFDSGSVPPDGTYELPGLPPGRYPYFCRLHPIMRGVLVVQGSETSS